MKSYDFLTEGIVEDAHEMHQDHEVQMARKDCYEAAENAIALHKLLRHVSENQGIEGWVAAKITLASDYLNTVREYLEYELMNQHAEPAVLDTAPVTLALPVAESQQVSEGKMKDLDLDLKKPPVGMTDQAFKKKYSMTKAEAKSKFTAKKDVAEGGFPGAPDVEMPPMQPSGDPQRDKLKQEYVDIHREIKSLVDLQFRGTSEEKIKAKARIKELNARADEIKAILEPRQPPNEWQKKTYGYDDNWNRVGKGATKGLSEMSAGSVATVVNPTPKNKAKVGTLFGGTYNQKSKKA